MTEKIDVNLDFGFEDEEDDTTNAEVIHKSASALKEDAPINTSISGLAAADLSSDHPKGLLLLDASRINEEFLMPDAQAHLLATRA